MTIQLQGSHCWNKYNRLVGDARNTVGNARRNGRQRRQLSAVVEGEARRVEVSAQFRAACKRQGIDPSVPFQGGPAARKARRRLLRQEGIEVTR